VEWVNGDPDGPVHKVRGGGLANRNMQERVEETFRRNTAAVAERVDTLVATTAARVVLIAGERQSRSRLRDLLGERAAAVAVEVEGSGEVGSDELRSAVDAAVTDVVDADRHALLERLDLALGRPEGLAVHGVEPVLAALRSSAVETLLLDGDVTRDGSVWISDVPTAVATDAEQLRQMGAEPTEQVPVDDALVRTAAASGAAFSPLGGGRTGLVGRPVDDGVAAILRFPLPEGA
jgi:peptide subunit release factor 1 (eRF1)